MKAVIAKLKRVWLRYLGYKECPICGQLSLKRHQVWLMHPEEPPLFGYWACTNCNAQTEIYPTSLSEDAVRSLGFESFENFMKEFTKKLHGKEGTK